MPKKIKKTCKNCVWLARKECDSPKKVCHRWIYKKASCVLCVYRKECKLLGKETSRDNVCLTFKKIKTKPKTKAKKLKIERSVKKLEKQLKKNPDELKDEFSPVGLIEDIISASYNPKVFELVDDRDIPKADNPIRFITDKSFMGIDLFPMQLKTFLEFFSSYCTRCSDTKFIRNEIEVDTPIGNIFDKTVLYHNGVCPKCGETKYEAVKKKRHCFYNQLIGVAGQRSSKSTSVGIISAAITHEYLKLPSPAEFFGLLPNSTLHGTFVGLRYSDARDNLWAPYYNLLTGTKWFQEYHSFLEEESLRLSTELFKIRDTFVAYNFKNLGIYPSGPDKRKLRGRCLPGYQLINTSKGLVRLDNFKKLLGATTYKGKHERKIIECIKQKKKKEVLRVTLENGIELDASPDHRVLSLNKKGRAIWKLQKDLLGRYVFCQLGGDFPKELVFNHKVKIHEPHYIKIAKYINKVKTFTIDEIAERFNLHKNSVLSYHLGPMIKANVLDRKSRRDELSHPLPSIYKVNSNFKLEDWNKLRKGVINNNREGITIPTRMTPALGRFIGYLIADGWVNLTGESIEFWTTSKDKNKDFNKLFKKLFNCNIRKGMDGTGYGPNKDKPCYTSAFSYNSITKFLSYLGMTKMVARTKKIPWCILEAPRDCAVECISAMISCDGGIINRSDKVGVYYSTKSHKLAKTLQLLIMKLGYICRRRRGYLYLLRGDSVDFLKNDYTGLNKRDWKEDSKINKVKNLKSWYRHKIPFSDSFVTSTLNKKFGRKIKKRFKRYCDQGIVFSKVVNIKSLGKRVVYDLRVNAEDSIFPSNSVLVHNTRIISALDEVGWFIGGSAGSTKFNPDEIYAALDNSLMTVLTASKRLFKKHPDIPTAYGLYISSPSSKTDKCMRMYKQSKGSRTMYGFHKSTWEFNPNITKKDLNEKYREDPVAAERDFGANPPYSSAPFIKGPSHIVPLFSKRKNLFKVTGYKTTSDSLGGTLLYPVVSFRNKHTFPCVLAVDTGYNHNSFACSLSHWFEKDGKLYYAVSGVIEIIPDPHPVSFPDVYDYVLTPILKEYNVKVVAFDRWQSIDLSQRTFKDHKIQAFSYSVTMKDFIDLKNKIYSGDCMFPKVEKEVEELLALKQELSSLIAGNPISHMFLQFLMCRDTGRTITKGDEITDDILKTICLGYSILTHEDYKDLFTFDGKMLNKYNKIDSIMSVNLRSQPNLGNLSNLGFQVRSVPGIGVIQSRNITR